MNNSKQVFIGVMPLAEAKRIQAKLQERDLPSELKTNEETCTRGCTVTVELWALDRDKEALMLFLQEESARDLAGIDINAKLLNEVFDPNADEVTCQACGEKFKPSHNECPACGLVY